MSGILLKITERGRGRRGRKVKGERNVRERDRKRRKILIFAKSEDE